MRRLVNREAEDLDDWVCRHGGPPGILEEVENATYVLSQWLTWKRKISTETEAHMISELGHFPSTGRCDALGRLLVELPSVSPKALGHFPLVVRAATKNDADERKEKKAPTSASRTQAKPKGRSEQLAKSLTVPDDSNAAGTRVTRYTMLSSSTPSSMQCSNAEQTTSMESLDILTCKAQRLRIGPDATRLELPILTVEYKRASDHLIKGTNQVRMYLTASVKFLQAVGIMNVPVYGVQTDGPIVVIPAAVLRDDDVRSLIMDINQMQALTVIATSTVRIPV
jgi:hypothetical protein